MELIDVEEQRIATLDAEFGRLTDQITRRRQGSGRRVERVAAVRARLSRAAVPAGLVPVVGPGLSVTLRDSALSYGPRYDANDLVVHEQDLRAVVNALWNGGAEAVSVNGERVLATSAIRCVGNTLLLHGALHAPPYRIAAIGDATSLQRALRRDPAARRIAAAAETHRLGYVTERSARLRVPAFRGRVAMRTAGVTGP